MNQQHLQQWSEVARHLQAPFQQLFALNIKVLQDFRFLKADDLANMKTPEEFIEKQVSLAIENGHRALDYFRQSFEIFEQTWQPLTTSMPTRQPMETVKSWEWLLDPEKLGMAPTTSAIDLAKPLLDSMSSLTDPAKAIMDIVASAMDTERKKGKTIPGKKSPY
ncbi:MULTISPECIES: phasin family protein [unclassified Legionella]|uniref:phasin family protein n=1 Tax=unclassified Legionella TaxID=2622702 RepID=UPI0010566BC0|nr:MULTISPECIES: phasin family protein [unclassified Legionella]MDI9819060.1 phasin family protein [Legionella sp. PL877]